MTNSTLNSGVSNITSSTYGTLTTTNTTYPGYNLTYDNNTNQIVWNNSSSSFNWGVDVAIDELCKLPYTINFSVDKKSQLYNNIFKVSEKYFIFNCKLDNNILTPYEYLMELIEDKIKIDVKIDISDVLTVNYQGLIFTKIKNNFTFGDKCDFSKLKVKFKYDEVLFENHKLTNKQKRTKKLNKIMKG